MATAVFVGKIFGSLKLFNYLCCAKQVAVRHRSSKLTSAQTLHYLCSDNSQKQNNTSIKKQLISFLLTCALLAVSLASNATIHYVYPGGSGARDGSSWADAAPDIQYLLTPPLIVVPIPTPPFFDTIQPQLVFDRDSIFVASGTYQRVCMHKEGYQVNNVTTDSLL
ncbi:MAG: hypothetical protein MJZ98_02350 [Paludibacteraceae bacterium]|nr:hypothetical protein [Paludibacteraceae bacterium]